MKSIWNVKRKYDITTYQWYGASLYSSFFVSDGLSEYLDLCKPGELNLRQDFSDKMNDNINAFHRKNYCAAYGDSHHEYKDLVDNMF